MQEENEMLIGNICMIKFDIIIYDVAFQLNLHCKYHINVIIPKGLRGGCVISDKQLFLILHTFSSDDNSHHSYDVFMINFVRFRNRSWFEVK